MEEWLEHDDRHRLVVLGSGKVGKTSLIRRFLYNDFPEKYRETVEDLHSRDFRVGGGGRLLSVDVLDTNHQFPDMRKLAITQANAFLIVFAVVSFREVYVRTCTFVQLLLSVSHDAWATNTFSLL